MSAGHIQYFVRCRQMGESEMILLDTVVCVLQWGRQLELVHLNIGLEVRNFTVYPCSNFDSFCDPEQLVYPCCCFPIYKIEKIPASHGEFRIK